MHANLIDEFELLTCGKCYIYDYNTTLAVRYTCEF